MPGGPARSPLEVEQDFATASHHPARRDRADRGRCRHPVADVGRGFRHARAGEHDPDAGQGAAGDGRGAWRNRRVHPLPGRSSGRSTCRLAGGARPRLRRCRLARRARWPTCRSRRARSLGRAIFSAVSRAMAPMRVCARRKPWWRVRASSTAATRSGLPTAGCRPRG